MKDLQVKEAIILAVLLGGLFSVAIATLWVFFDSLTKALTY